MTVPVHFAHVLMKQWNTISLKALLWPILGQNIKNTLYAHSEQLGKTHKLFSHVIGPKAESPGTVWLMMNECAWMVYTSLYDGFHHHPSLGGLWNWFVWFIRLHNYYEFRASLAMSLNTLEILPINYGSHVVSSNFSYQIINIIPFSSCNLSICTQ